MDVRLLGKKNEGEGLGVAVLVDSAFAELRDKSDEQLAEAQRFLIDFMKKVARLKGVRIDRPHFLRSELRRKGVHKDVGEFAVETTPVTAGIDVGLGSVEKVGVAPDPKRVGPASWNLEHG